MHTFLKYVPFLEISFLSSLFVLFMLIALIQLFIIKSKCSLNALPSRKMEPQLNSRISGILQKNGKLINIKRANGNEYPWRTQNRSCFFFDFIVSFYP